MNSSVASDDFALNLASASNQERDSLFLSPGYALFVPRPQNADFHFLPAIEKLGSLNYDRVRGNEVFSFRYDTNWLNQYGNIRLGGDLGTFPGLQMESVSISPLP